MRRAASMLLSFLVACGGTVEPAAPGPAETAGQVFGTVCRRDAIGSGIVVGSDLFLTSAHVIAGVDGLLEVRRPGGEPLQATVVGFDAERDLALLRVPGLGGTSAEFGVASAGTEGAIATVDRDGRLDLVAFVVARLVTANSGDIYDEGEVVRAALQLDATILPGDSGGALFDDENRVVGVAFAQSNQADDVAYALATSEIENFLAEVNPATEAATGRCR